MNTNYLDAEWGINIERVILKTKNNGNRVVYQASELQPQKAVVYVEMNNKIYVARVGRIETRKTSGNVQEGQANIQLDIPGAPPITLKSHIEKIPYGFDKPDRYELIVDQQVDAFETLGDYEELRKQFVKESVLKNMITQFMSAEKGKIQKDKQELFS